MRMDTFEHVRLLLGEVLQLGSRTDKLTASTLLVGGLPEFDSLAVVSVVSAIEQQFGVGVDDDEIDAEVFESVGSLAEFVAKKIETAPGSSG